MFTNVVARWLGSTHDSHVFRTCIICTHLQINPLSSAEAPYGSFFWDIFFNIRSARGVIGIPRSLPFFSLPRPTAKKPLRWKQHERGLCGGERNQPSFPRQWRPSWGQWVREQPFLDDAVHNSTKRSTRSLQWRSRQNKSGDRANVWPMEKAFSCVAFGNTNGTRKGLHDCRRLCSVAQHCFTAMEDGEVDELTDVDPYHGPQQGLSLKCLYGQQGFCCFGISITSKNVFKPKKLNSNAFFPWNQALNFPLWPHPMKLTA